MKKLILTIAALTLATAFAACGGSTTENKPAANNTNANNAAAKPAAAAPTKEALMKQENAAWEAWKNNDAKFFEGFYSAKYRDFGPGGIRDKAASLKSMAEAKCDVKSYSLSDEQMHMAGPDVAFLTYKAAQDGTCSGKKIPAAVYSASIYIREGNDWKAAYYGEAPVPDPKAPAKSAAPAPAKKDDAKAEEAKPDAATDALLAVEKKAWDAWKAKDAKALEDFAAQSMTSLMYDTGWAGRDEAIKKWSTEPCEIKSIGLSDAQSVSYDANTALLLFKSTVDGKCGGMALGSEWGATLYVKEGGDWKALMTMGVPIS